MIWSTDHTGSLTYISPEWTTLTGQPAQDTRGDGWLAMVHPDDRIYCRNFLQEAVATRVEFTARYRVSRVEGGYIWIVAGAVPSFGPPEETFLGYFGSLTEIGPSESDAVSAYGTLGAFRPPMTLHSEPVRTPVDLIADHVLMAHVLAAEADEPELQQSLDATLRILGKRLAALELQPFGGASMQ